MLRFVFIERAKARAAKGEHDGDLNNPDKVAGLIGIMKNRQKPIGKGERFDRILEAHENDEDNVALVNALLGRTPSPTKRNAPAAAEPDTVPRLAGLPPAATEAQQDGRRRPHGGGLEIQ